MRPRFRVLAALVTLLAFSASFAEGVWASTCMGMGSMDESVDADGMGDMGSMPSMDSGASHGDGMAAPENASETPPCPLTAAIGSCVALSLPACEPAAEFGSASQSAEGAAPAVTPELLFATALLRPPRA